VVRARAMAVALAAIVAASVLSVVPAAGAPDPGEAGAGAQLAAAPVVAPTLDPFDRTSVLDAYEASLVAARTVPIGWTGSVATCTRGTESAASIEATRAAVNFYRALNRLPAATMDATANGKALAAALNMAANTRLDHAPASTSACYSADAYAGASSSNLAKASPGLGRSTPTSASWAPATRSPATAAGS
jgi:uncharacterized protein YkwD